jgi:hypothetical protein
MSGVRGRRSRQSEPRLAAWVALVLMAGGCTHAGAGLKTYASSVGGDARIVPEGQLVRDGKSVICGRRVTVLNSKLDDYAAAAFLFSTPG